jgi:hypothetical protein
MIKYLEDSKKEYIFVLLITVVVGATLKIPIVGCLA